MMAASSKAASKDPEALKRELWGWYAYDFANSAFFQSAGTVRTSPFFFCLRFLAVVKFSTQKSSEGGNPPLPPPPPRLNATPTPTTTTTTSLSLGLSLSLPSPAPD